jgi:hypothetical protein
MMVKVRRKTKQDKLDEERRRKSLEQTIKDLAALDEKIMAGKYQRLVDISDEEWQAAVDADAGGEANA